jgi:hypothetical protein
MHLLGTGWDGRLTPAARRKHAYQTDHGGDPRSAEEPKTMHARALVRAASRAGKQMHDADAD